MHVFVNVREMTNVSFFFFSPFTLITGTVTTCMICENRCLRGILSICMVSHFFVTMKRMGLFALIIIEEKNTLYASITIAQKKEDKSMCFSRF